MMIRAIVSMASSLTGGLLSLLYSFAKVCYRCARVGGYVMEGGRVLGYEDGLCNREGRGYTDFGRKSIAWTGGW